jgi:hypothetical protein
MTKVVCDRMEWRTPVEEDEDRLMDLCDDCKGWEE